jgi:hypothetical protein
MLRHCTVVAEIILESKFYGYFEKCYFCLNSKYIRWRFAAFWRLAVRPIFTVQLHALGNLNIENPFEIPNMFSNRFCAVLYGLGQNELSSCSEHPDKAKAIWCERVRPLGYTGVHSQKFLFTEKLNKIMRIYR